MANGWLDWWRWRWSCKLKEHRCIYIYKQDPCKAQPFFFLDPVWWRILLKWVCTFHTGDTADGPVLCTVFETCTVCSRYCYETCYCSYRGSRYCLWDPYCSYLVGTVHKDPYCCWKCRCRLLLQEQWRWGRSPGSTTVYCCGNSEMREEEEVRASTTIIVLYRYVCTGRQRSIEIIRLV
jgi:hypothetical protein